MESEANNEAAADLLAGMERRRGDRQLPTLTADGIVSYNLMRARELRGWTQQEAADRISRHLGKDWSVPVYAAAERAHRSSRVKEFSADELVALSRAFNLPFSWWLLPPGPYTRVKARNAEEEAAISGDELLSLLFPAEGSMVADLETRTEDLFNQFAAQAPPSGNLASYLSYVNRRNATLQAMAHSAFKSAGLENAAGELEDLARRWRQALGQLTSDLRHEGVSEPSEES